MFSIVTSFARIVGACIGGMVSVVASVLDNGRSERRARNYTRGKVAGRRLASQGRRDAEPTVWAVKARTWGMRGWQTVELFDSKADAIDFMRGMLSKGGVVDVVVKKM